MNLYLRLLVAMASALRSRRLSVNDVTTRTFRVWPHDLDAFGHMNNGRYLQIMDVARTDWMVRTGTVQTMWRNRWSALLGAGMTHYRHPLRLFQRYQVRSRLVHWDKRWFFFEHSFIDERQRLIAVGLSRAAVRANNSWVTTREAIEKVCPSAYCPEAPDYLAKWLSTDGCIFNTAQNFAKGEEPDRWLESTREVAS